MAARAAHARLFDLISNSILQYFAVGFKVNEDTVDNIAPDAFEYTTIVTSNSITVNALTTDTASVDAGLSRQFPDVPKKYWGYYIIAEATTGHDYVYDEYMMYETWTQIK